MTNILCRTTLLALVLVQFGLTFPDTGHADDYELGQGWHAGDYYISGYANIEAADEFGAPADLVMDDLSLLASGTVNRWFNPFTETELTSYTLLRQGGNYGSGDLIVERFYNDLQPTQNDTLRIGKMLAPVGEWNLVHAAPLIPLFTRPYTTAQGFDAYVSGISWLHEQEGGANPGLQLYWQPDNELFKRPVSQTNRHFHNVYGGHINLPLSLIDKIGASVQGGKLVETGETFTLFGANASKTIGKLRLESEALTASFSGAVLPGATRFHGNEAGIFALANYAFTPQWHGILEGEYYQDHLVDLPSRTISVAATYKPSVPMIWKIEYTHQAGVSASIAPINTGLFASFATFF